MKQVNVPKVLVELFGRQTTLFEVWLTVVFAGLTSSLIIGYNFSEFQVLGIWQKIVVLALLVDISGGVIANLSFGTNEYYRQKAKRRLIFLLVHVQPLVLMLVYPQYWIICLGTWLFTVLSAYLVTRIKGTFQSLVAMFFTGLGIVGLFILGKELPQLLLLLLLFYLLKVCYSFAVNHFK